MELSDRKKKILRAVVENYVQTAEPVGSKTIMEISGLQISSATIRNEMAELEAMGLLEQPHTSAGRVPSPTGYRFYVNELMEEHRLTLQETQSINDVLHLRIREMDQVINEAGKVISQLTKYPTFALTRGNAKVSISRFDLLPVEQDSLIVVLLTNTQVARTKLLRLSEVPTDEQLPLLNTLLNSTFTGKNLEEMPNELSRVGSHAAGDTYKMIRPMVEFAMEVLQELESNVVRTAGIPNLLAHPEYQTLNSAEPLMNYLAHWDHVADMPSASSGSVEILIGPENVAQELKNSSIIMARYDIGDNMQGVIGVVGPTRMDYAKLAARLSYFAEGLSRMFGKGELPPPAEEGSTIE